MPLITEIQAPSEESQPTIFVPIDRHTLMKRRWRTTADDGTDLAIDLAEPCNHGDLLLVSKGREYRVIQQPEKVVRIKLPESVEESARLGWFLGNQHLPVEIGNQFIQLAHHEHLVMRLAKAGIQMEILETVFCPDPHSATPHHH